MLYCGAGKEKTEKETRLARRKQATDKIDRKLRSLNMLVDDIYLDSEKKVVLNHLKREVEKMQIKKQEPKKVKVIPINGKRK